MYVCASALCKGIGRQAWWCGEDVQWQCMVCKGKAAKRAPS